mgnify:CR=1 FL=1|jgi:hypothetical protein
MKILILKLGLFIFSLLFVVGVYKQIPTDTILYRSFVAFLAIETMLVLMAVIFIKMTERMRRDEEDFFDEGEMEPEAMETEIS